MIACSKKPFFTFLDFKFRILVLTYRKTFQKSESLLFSPYLRIFSYKKLL